MRKNIYRNIQKGDICMRYQFIEGFDDILAGISDKSKESEDAIAALNTYSEWFAQVLTLVINFFKSILPAIEKK